LTQGEHDACRDNPRGGPCRRSHRRGWAEPVTAGNPGPGRQGRDRVVVPYVRPHSARTPGCHASRWLLYDRPRVGSQRRSPRYCRPHHRRMSDDYAGRTHRQRSGVLTAVLVDVVTVLAQDPGGVLPPTSPVGPPSEALSRFTQAVGWVKWAATAVLV